MKEFYSITTKCLKAIADPKRLRIIDMLSSHERCASDILEEFQVTQPTLSHDMKILSEAGLVNSRKIGKKVSYTLNHENLNRLLAQLGGVFQPKSGIMENA
ncbi:ArsR/SmtB family transcription factor [Allisonella histaminiformans]|uniref:ArsR/SmtB family transcription factor n=1 Tax=Allisonella histaminiformans TaxID=209880 RepID=UPI000D792882|nr:metalloregulator ArsR/SmtB family transcription factor [Allisonella histaminiformans]PWL46068.1 MAG: transcriptional regulator [Veillonellaceae bacterium]